MMPEPETPAEVEKKSRKKQDKIRSAWISFVGRIVAQLIGAATPIIVGIVLLKQYQPGGGQAGTTVQPSPPAAERVTPARARRNPGEPALAVLPMQNFSGDPQQDFFADGMTEALTADLAQVRGLRVISRTSSQAYKGQRKPLTEIARELDVDMLVEGSVTRAGDRIRVTAQLIDADTDEHLWARSYDRTVRDVLALQGEIAAAIAAEVGGMISAPARNRMTGRGQVDPAAYDLYLRGRYAWNLRSDAGYRDAIRFFEEATRTAPDFALAYAGLADVYQLGGAALGVTGAAARAAATRALAIDDGLAEAHASLGGVLHRTDGNVRAAEREFQRALELKPGYATAHQWYAILLAEEARDAEAMTHAQRAVALDPLGAPMYQTLTLVHYYGRRYDEVITTARRALQMAPHLTLPRDFEARALVAKGVNRVPAQKPEEAGALVRWHALSGDRNGALEALERLVAERPAAMQALKNDPALDSVRSDARFVALVRRAAQVSSESGQ